MVKKKLIIVDDASGSVIGEYKIKKRGVRDYYVLMFMENIYKERKNFSYRELKVLGMMGRDNRIKANIVKGIKGIRMVLLRMIENGKAIKEGYGNYFINPYYCCKTNIYRIKGLREQYTKMLYERNKVAIKKKGEKRDAGYKSTAEAVRIVKFN